MLPEMFKVDSSIIHRIGFKEDCGELFVELEDSTFVYHEVTKVIFENFIQSKNVGEYLLNVLEDKFSCTKYEIS